jgi:tetratricopeptide (TPR) repeat protein
MTRVGAFDSAEAVLKAALKAAPDDARLRRNLAACYESKGTYHLNAERWPEAAAAFKLSLEADPTSEQADLMPGYLQALLFSGHAEDVLSETDRFEKRGWKPPTGERPGGGYEKILWGIRAIAAVLTGRDQTEALGRATAAPPDRSAGLRILDQIDKWSQQATLNPDQRKSVSRIVSGLRKSYSTSEGLSVFERILVGENKVFLLQGKNVRGMQVYCYLLIPYRRIRDLEAAMDGKGGFNLTDFGEVLAAGTGDPPQEVRDEIDRKYPTVKRAAVMLPGGKGP